MTIAAPATSRAYFVYLDIENDPVRVNSSGWPIYWNGYKWLGVGSLGGISGLSHDTQMTASNLTLTINDVPTRYLDCLDDKAYQEREAIVWQADLDESYQIISSVVVWVGYMDTAEIEAGSVSIMHMHCEGPGASWNRRETRRLNDATQQKRFPGDRAAEYMAALAKVTLKL